MMFLGPLFLALIIGFFFHCAVRALVLLIQAGREREAPARSKELRP
jgi:hypothetical protein